MSDIDNLQIKISADANKATNALNKLASSLTNFQRSLSIDTSKLTSISNSIQSIANAASSMNTSGIKNISTLTNSINRMGKIDTSGLSRISSALKTFSADMAGTKVDGVGDIASIASSISRLGGVASGRAITNIPLLAKNLKQLFTTLSTAPNVSENIIRMTNALAGLASTGAASGRAANSLGRNLNTYTASAKRATKSTFSLAAAFGKFYATYFLVIRGIKSLWKSIEGTTDYIEAFNYYTVAFNKVGKEWGKDFEKFGYDNAEDYAQSFGNRVNELLGKMSGLKVDVDGGLISESGMKNLGLNLQEITQYASQLASITNSLGQTGEVTTAISKSMTMLAGDISSLFNVDFSTVANNLQSGLIGQSRALYKYGIDITNATLQTYAYRYGIEKAVSEMSQAEKQQLRLLAILDQSKVSWGDLANTINSPSNMIRQFTNNVKEAGMVLGQLFIPVLQKVLPVINGVVIAIKRLLVSVANLLGIKIDFSSFGQGVSGYNEDLEDTADALDKVGTSAKNAQSGIRAFDKLKVISTPKSSGSGSGAGGAGIDLTKEIMDATAEYEKVWQEAFDKMQNTAIGWADKIEKLFEPVKKLFKDLFNGDFFEAGQDLSGIVTGIFNWMSDAIASVDWYQIGQNIGQFLAGIDWTAVFTSAGNFIETAIDAAIDLWKGSFDAAPIETTIITAIGLLKFTGVGDIIWGKISDKLSSKVLGSSIGIVPTIAIAAVTWEIGFNVGKSLGKALFPEDAEYYDNFTWFGENGFFDTLKNTDFTTLKNAWDDLYKDITDNDLYRFLTGTMLLPKHSTLDDFGDKIDWLIDKIKNTKVDMSDTFGLSSALINIAPLVGNWFNENVSPWFTKEKWQGMGQTIESSLSEKWTSFTTWWNQTGFSNWWKKISEQFGLTKWNKLLENIPTAFRTAFKTAANVAIAPLNLVISGIETMINNAIDLINGLMSAARLIPKIGDAVPNNIQHISVGRIPTFEKGGYVPSRYTMFMAGENGVPEIAGTVGGKTAVAGGVEITGIKDAINSTAQQEIALLKQNNQLLQGILEKEFGITTDQIGVAARKYGQEQFNQKHKNVYVF
nr:MAG TPA: minor tail protein [Bacteriophage sp.]